MIVLWIYRMVSQELGKNLRLKVKIGYVSPDPGYQVCAIGILGGDGG